MKLSFSLSDWLVQAWAKLAVGPGPRRRCPGRAEKGFKTRVFFTIEFSLRDGAPHRRRIGRKAPGPIRPACFLRKLGPAGKGRAP
jgi:hypothetical protein